LKFDENGVAVDLFDNLKHKQVKNNLIIIRKNNDK